MIELKDAQAQMNRMIGLKFGPRASQQKVEVLRVMRNARTATILESAVTSWIDSQPDFPKPSEIRAILTGLNAMHDEAAGKARAACIACGGSGWVIVDGVNPFDGLKVTGAKPCSCRSTGMPVVRDADACATCGGDGLYGGRIGTQFDGPWKWCDCPAGRDRREKEPDAVAEGNIAREKLIRRFGPKPLPGMLRQLAENDAYHGEF